MNHLRFGFFLLNRSSHNPFRFFIFLGLIVLPILSCISSANSDSYKESRARMVKNDIENRGIHDHAVKEAMLKVPRHLFVGPENIEAAYRLCPTHQRKPNHIAALCRCLDDYRCGIELDRQGVRNRNRVRLSGSGAR